MLDSLLTQKEFISLFPHTRFRYIHDVIENKTTQGSDVLDLSWNEKGYGIFYTVNGFPPTGKADQSQLISLNGNYTDFDVDVNLSQQEKDKLIQETLMLGLEAGIPTPTIINRTQKGAHLIWLYPETLQPTQDNIERWKDVQLRIVHCFKGDTAAVDPSRVLRLPYSLHLKDPMNPFKITVMSYKPEAYYTLDELDSMTPEYSQEEVDTNKIPARELLSRGVKVGEGMRHMGMAQVAGLALKGATTSLQVEIARLALYGWDRTVVRSPEPFQQRKKELDNTIDGIFKREMAGKKANANTADKKPHLWAISEILGSDFGEEEWLVESLISKQGMTALSGNPGDFKTWVTIHIALSLSRSTPVFGKFQTTQGAVLVIDEEDHIRLLKKRLELLKAEETDSIHYLSQSGIKVDTEEALTMIIDIVKEKNIKLVILDSLVRIHQQEENDAGGMAKVFSSLQKVMIEGASILFTHHHRKQMGFGSNNNPGQSMRGSSDILAAVDCHITIEKKRDEADRLVIKQTKLRQGELLPPFEIKILKGPSGPAGFEYLGEYDERRSKAEVASGAVVLVLINGMKCRAELHELLEDEFGKTAIDDGIKIACDSGKIEKVPKDELPKDDRKKAYYRLPTSASEIQHNDLPASVEYIETEKQEDEYHDGLEGYKGPLSICCGAPMVGGAQCLTCGADGRSDEQIEKDKQVL